MIDNQATQAALTKPVRTIEGRVELLSGSALLDIFGYEDRLISFTVERVGEAKFFGFGVCQKLNVKLLDPKRELNITTEHRLEASLGVSDGYVYPFPYFKVTEVHRDENTNELSITAYDALEQAGMHTVSELALPQSYSIKTFVTACASFLGLPVAIDEAASESFALMYPTGANFDGTETLRDALTAAAEATQTVYFISKDWALTFKRLDLGGLPVLTIDKEAYITLDSKTNKRLGTIYHTTELGDDVYASTTESGSTQYVRDNPFWTLRDDIGSLVDAALAAVGGLTINQYSCTWRGNYLLELADKIALEAKDGSMVSSYLLDDTLTYDGTLSQSSQWSYEDNEQETAENPTNLGEALKKTYARVNKAEQTIDLVASDTAADKEAISHLQLTTEEIAASVQATREAADEALEGVNEQLGTLTTKAEASVTSEQVQLLISSELADGVSKVVTETGFTFDEQGLTVSKSDSDISTAITEDGMQVLREGEAVLTANNEGVQAEDLHATTYLIIGNNSRFEDYSKEDKPRTGCFWIGETTTEEA